MITSIHVGARPPFGDDGVTLEGCSKINVIYGANGVGKTTISRALRDHETDDGCGLEWDGGSVPVLVYNSDFREKNVRESPTMPGVFTIGEANAEATGKLDRLRDERAAKIRLASEDENAMALKRGEADDLRKRLRDKAWKEAFLKHEQDFPVKLLGIRRSKDAFLDKLLSVPEETGEVALAIDDLKRRAGELSEDNLVKWPELASEGELQRLRDALAAASEIEGSEIWNRALVGKSDVPLAALIESMQSQGWVRAGKRFLSIEPDVCPFCQQPVSGSDLMGQLEEFFDETFEEGLDEIGQLADRYEEARRQVGSVMGDVQTRAESIGHGLDSAFSGSTRALLAVMERNLSVMRSKHDEPNERKEVALTSGDAALLLRDLAAACDVVENHNSMVDSAEAQRDLLARDAWAFMAHSLRSDISLYKQRESEISVAIGGLRKEVDEISGRLADIEGEIASISSRLTGTENVVEEINRILRGSGFNGFEIAQESEGRYRIARPDGSDANRTLSEGEETLISFLYFYHLAQGGLDVGDAATQKVVVLDDPVSSLDSNALFLISVLSKDLCKDACSSTPKNVQQVFIFTHNVFFHREMTVNVKGRAKRRMRFWMLYRGRASSAIRSYGQANPVTSSYEAMWRELRDALDDSFSQRAPNLMRRILETFFGLLGWDDWKVGVRELFEGEDAEKADLSVCEALLAWANEGSHSAFDDVSVSLSPGDSRRYFRVFCDIFKKAGYESHLRMMIKDYEELLSAPFEGQA